MCRSRRRAAPRHIGRQISVAGTIRNRVVRVAGQLSTGDNLCQKIAAFVGVRARGRACVRKDSVAGSTTCAQSARWIHTRVPTSAVRAASDSQVGEAGPCLRVRRWSRYSRVLLLPLGVRATPVPAMLGTQSFVPGPH